MSQPKEYLERYKIAKKKYVEEGLSLTAICKELHMDRGSLANNLRADGIEIINKQNMTKFNENFFDEIDTEEKAYWLGFLYADGSVATNDNLIELSLKASDYEHLEKFKNALDFIEDKHIFVDDVRCRLSIRNKHLRQQLISLGCVPQKSLILTFPTDDQVPDKFIKHFVRGYIDGDGSVMLGENHLGEKVKPRLNILGTQEFLTVLRETMGWRENAMGQKDEIYNIEYGGKYVYDYLYDLYENATVYLDRKYNKYLEIKNILDNCQPQK